jgi:hypothetical protein
MRTLTLLSIVALSALPAAVAAEEGAKDGVVAKLERLLKANKTKEATQLAMKEYGADWCEMADLKAVEPGNRRYATLGVLARRTGEYGTAARCAVAAVMATDSAKLAAAALYELSRVAARLTDAELKALGEISSVCSHLFAVQWPDGLDKAEGMASRRLRAKATEDLLHQSLRLNPTRAVVAALAKASQLGRTEVRDALAAYAPAELVVRGPFANPASARAAMRREAEMSPEKRRPVQPKKPATVATAGDWKLGEESIQLGCDESWFATLERSGTVYFVPVLYNLYQGEDCGGYGEASSGGAPKWVVPQHIARVQAVHSEYTNSSCGPTGRDEEPDAFCELSGPAPRCLDLGGVRSWVSTEGRVGGASTCRGVDVRYSVSKGVTFKRTTGPRELTKALRALDGATLPQLLQRLGPVLDAASAELSR